MNQAETFLDILVAALERAGGYNRLTEEPPAAILWPDRERAWASLVPRLRARLPVLTLGPYEPEQASGPVAWLRCMVARSLPGCPPPGVTPVLYLPGAGSQDLRNPGKRIADLAALVDLIYRGALWCDPDGRDWTIASFLADRTHGLGVEVRHDAATSAAMQRTLSQIAGLPVARLREDAPWRASDFDALIGYHGVRNETDVRQLIAQGESAELEFKATARWDVREGRKSAVMEQIIVKTVAGFLNSQSGGTLLIGVRDDGSIHGLADDYQAWKAEKRNKDSYELWLMELLLGACGRELAPFIKPAFHTIEGKEICQLTIYPAPKPVFAREKDAKSGELDEVFYARTGNATNKLNNRALLEYVRIRWGTL
jgi:hypothetical protein